jgi:Protein of unknown function (DUF2892)
MKQNMGLIDKVIRIVVAIIMIVVGYFIRDSYGILSIILFIFAGIFILTSFIGFCPLYTPFKMNTAKKE